MPHIPSIVYVSTPQPGSAQALERALGLARVAQVPLTVLVPGGGRNACRPAANSAEVRLVEGSSRGQDVQLVELPGPASPQAVVNALPDETGLVIKVADDLAGMSQRPPVPDRVLLRTLPCSLWLVPAVGMARSRVVLAAVVVHDDPPDVGDVAVLRLASALAEWEGAHLHVVHAWSFIGESILACPLRGLGPARARRVLNRLREERVSELKSLMTSVGVGHVGWTLGKGMPSQVIRKAAAGTGADVLVSGYRGRTGLWGLVLGNLTEGFVSTQGLGLVFVRAHAPDLTSVRRQDARTA